MNFFTYLANAESLDQVSFDQRVNAINDKYQAAKTFKDFISSADLDSENKSFLIKKATDKKVYDTNLPKMKMEKKADGIRFVLNDDHTLDIKKSDLSLWINNQRLDFEKMTSREMLYENIQKLMSKKQSQRTFIDLLLPQANAGEFTGDAGHIAVIWTAIGNMWEKAFPSDAKELIKDGNVRSITCTLHGPKKDKVYLPTEVDTGSGYPKTSSEGSLDYPFLPLKIEYGKDGKITKFTDGYGCKHQGDVNGNLKRIVDTSEDLKSRCRNAGNQSNVRNYYDVFPNIKKERFFKLLNSVCANDPKLDKFNEEVKEYVQEEKRIKAKAKDKPSRYNKDESAKGIK